MFASAASDPRRKIYALFIAIFRFAGFASRVAIKVRKPCCTILPTRLAGGVSPFRASLPAKLDAVLPWWPTRSKAWPHRLERRPKRSPGTSCRRATTARSVQAIKKIAATIEQLSDVANGCCGWHTSAGCRRPRKSRCGKGHS